MLNISEFFEEFMDPQNCENATKQKREKYAPYQFYIRNFQFVFLWMRCWNNKRRKRMKTKEFWVGAIFLFS